MQECTNELCELALDIGECLLKNGAEINRIEDTISRICCSAGAQDTEVFCIIKAIVMTVKKADGTTYSSSKRITSTESNFKRIEKLNSLSRNICEGKLSLEAARNKFERIKSGYECPFFKKFIGYLVFASSCAVYFGGSWLDALMTVPAAIFMALYNRALKERGINRAVYNFIACFLSGIIIILLSLTSLPIHISSVITGTLMILIPGIALSSSIEDLLLGDTTSGILNICESILAAVSIALGYGLALKMFGFWNTYSPPIEYELWIMLLMSFLSSLGYAFMGNVSTRAILYSSFGGIVAYLVYFLVLMSGANNFVSLFVASCAGTLYSRILATRLCVPTPVFSTPTLIPLAPGNALYLTIHYALKSDWGMMQKYALDTIIIASGIALGILSVTLLWKLFRDLIQEIKNKGKTV
jgi:uncharacterized membrane protein YjjP (DUF1212 family)